MEPPANGQPVMTEMPKEEAPGGHGMTPPGEKMPGGEPGHKIPGKHPAKGFPLVIQTPEGLLMIGHPGAVDGYLRKLHVDDQFFEYSSGRDRLFPNINPQTYRQVHLKSFLNRPTGLSQNRYSNSLDKAIILDRYLNGRHPVRNFDPRLHAFFDGHFPPGLTRIPPNIYSEHGPGFLPFEREYANRRFNHGYDREFYPGVPDSAYPPISDEISLYDAARRSPVFRISRVLKTKDGQSRNIDTTSRTITSGPETKTAEILPITDLYDILAVYNDHKFKNGFDNKNSLGYRSYPPMFYYLGGGICP